MLKSDDGCLPTYQLIIKKEHYVKLQDHILSLEKEFLCILVLKKKSSKDDPLMWKQRYQIESQKYEYFNVNFEE